MDTPDGFDRAPARYTANGRETVDVMRDRAHLLAKLIIHEADGLTAEELADTLFVYACWTHEFKYKDRIGKKGSHQDASNDGRKALWWGQMAEHLGDPANCPDPRSNRSDYTPYQRPTP